MATADMSWNMGKKEIVLLAAYMGGDVIIGIEDPFSGWLAEQVEKEWPKAKKALAGKGYISEKEDGISFDPQIKETIGICCKPDVFLMIKEIKSDSEQTNITLNISEEKGLLAVVAESGEEARISLYPGEELEKILSAILALPSPGRKAIVKTELSHSRISAWGSNASDQNNYENMALMKNLITDPDRKILIITGNENKQKPQLSTLGLFIKGNDILRAEETDNDLLTAESVFAEDIFEEISKIVGRV